jgi:hypothetical protein
VGELLKGLPDGVVRHVDVAGSPLLDVAQKLVDV